MHWYEEAIFYHIYPLGLCDAPIKNSYEEPVNRISSLKPWVDHIAELGFNALYIGPLFESVGHGYETTDYRKLDSRLGTNEDLKDFISYCHGKGIRVIIDAVFNHTGRDFFAFNDIRCKRENSPYLNWYQNVNLYGNNSYNDGFSYDTWGGYDLLAKLNLYNQDVIDYHLDTVRFWVREFDIDGLRLDAADVLNFEFMRQLRNLSDTVKEDFWLMGEVIHGEYGRWVNQNTLHSVTNYQMHKALYSAHNDHNYFEIAHTLKRQFEICGNDVYRLYLFADNHDVERIASRLNDLNDYFPLLVLLYTLPGIPSIYYGSEFAIEGKKERYSDLSLRPHLDLNEMKKRDPFYPELIRRLSKIRKAEKALSYGEYKEVSLTTGTYVYRRGDILICVNNLNDEQNPELQIDGSYIDALSGRKIETDNGKLSFTIAAHAGMILIPENRETENYEPIRIREVRKEIKKAETGNEEIRIVDKPYEEMSIDELQDAILAKMKKNGPLNDRMIKDVRENVYRDSLLNWVRSFR